LKRREVTGYGTTYMLLSLLFFHGTQEGC